MKLLFDQNLSFKLVGELADLFPSSDHVARIGLAQADDLQIWAVALAGHFILVSQDADFSELAVLRRPPQKVIWLRCGNRSTAYISALLRTHAAAIVDFAEDDTAVCLELY